MKAVICAVTLFLSSAFAQQSGSKLARHWDYDKHAPLKFQQQSVRERDGVKIYEITYSAPVDDRGALAGPNAGLVTASLVVPPGRGPFPALIYGHWCMPGS